MKTKIFFGICIAMTAIFFHPFDKIAADDKKNDGTDRGGHQGGGGGHQGSQGGGGGGHQGSQGGGGGGHQGSQGGGGGRNRESQKSGGDHGGSRGNNQNFSRSPSMSRTQVPQRTNYSRSNQWQDGQGHQQATQTHGPSERRISSPSYVQGGHSMQQAQQYMQNSRFGQRAQAHINPSNNINRDQFNQVRQSLPSQINRQSRTAQDYRSHFGNTDRNWFNKPFWNHHNYQPNYWNNQNNWWDNSSWSSVNGWLGNDWSEPIYYQEGYPIYINNNSETNYLLPPPPPPPQYPNINVNVNQTDQLVGDNTNDQGDWIPLGVYALVNNLNDAAGANMFFQLALGKDGSISGSYYNTSSDRVFPVEGIVDRNTQIVLWKMSEGEGAPIFQTGLFNLTKDQTAVDVTYSDGSEQTWLLVRIPESS